MNSKRFCFVRHGESIKNINEVHGGDGYSLTNKGKQECFDLVKKIKSYDHKYHNKLVVGHNVKQVTETINIFVSKLCCDSINDDRIRGIHLGIANGKSKDELKIISPLDAKNLELWRSKKLTISELKVTGMEPIDSFYERINNFLKYCYCSEKYNLFIVVCTTSVMIMIVNLYLLGDEFSFNQYRHIKINPADFFCYDYNNNKMELIETSIDL